MSGNQAHQSPNVPLIKSLLDIHKIILRAKNHIVRQSSLLVIMPAHSHAKAALILLVCAKPVLHCAPIDDLPLARSFYDECNIAHQQAGVCLIDDITQMIVPQMAKLLCLLGLTFWQDALDHNHHATNTPLHIRALRQWPLFFGNLLWSYHAA